MVKKKIRRKEFEGNQIPHDSFYKRILPGSEYIRKLVAEKFELDAATMNAMIPYPTEFQSRAVAKALHHSEPWKVLHSDGLYQTSEGNVIGYEYQSTHNSGMLIRTHMYDTAFREQNPNLSGKGVKFVVINSSKDIPNDLANKHGDFIEENVRYLFIDLNQIPPEDLEIDGPHSMVLRLARADATEFEKFAEAARIITENVSDANERDNLMLGLMVAAMNTPHIFKKALKEFHVNRIVRQNIREAAPVLKAMEKADLMRDNMLRGLEMAKAPDGLAILVERTADDELDNLWTRLIKAGKSGNWEGLVEEAENLSSAPSI